MRKQLLPAKPGATLREVLAQIGPRELAGYLKEGAGFAVQFGVPGITMERLPGKDLRYRFAGTGVVATVAIEVSAELGTAVQQVTLTNEGEQPSPPIQVLQAFQLPLTVMQKDAPRACWFGGGVPDGIYPPRAYREEEACFGQAREWLPLKDTTNLHWWLRGRSTTLTSEFERGWSSIPHIPLIEAGWETGNGEVGLWAALEWSARWQMHLGSQPDGCFVFDGGPWVKGPVLEPGEALRLPRVHVGVYGGPGATRVDGFNRIRRYVAEALAPDVEGGRPWPFMAYNHWFGMEERISEAGLRREVDRAAELGLEYFVVDAGWYANPGKHYFEGLGNWDRVDEAKFPNGLEAIADYARTKGLRFGLWFEPERARQQSDYYQQHPDWFLSLPGRIVYVTNFAKREVQDGFIEMLSRWVAKLDIRWLRWDFSHAPGPYWDHIDPTGKIQFGYCEGVYRVRDELLKRHPNLMIDTCAGGGHRVEFGMLKSAGTMVISDHAADPHICRIMQTGGARILPGNYMNSSLYLGEEEGDAQVGPLDVVSRMAGSLTFAGYISNFTKRHTTLLRRHLDGYRTFRHLLMKAFYPLRPYPRSAEDWDIVQFADPESHEAVILAYRVRGQTKTQRVFPQNLDPALTYEVADPFSAGKTRRVTGKELADKGLLLTLAPESALVRHLKPVS